MSKDYQIRVMRVE